MYNFCKILIIGAGNIGSRHLQGILKSSHKLNITIVDPKISSLKLCKTRVKEIKFGNINSKIIYRKTIPYGEFFKISIIATNSNVRSNVTKELLSKCSTKCIIFEKILFQKNLDYKNIGNLLKKKKVKAWVNCPRRIFSIYKNIKKTLNSNFDIEMSIEGSSWGMACNSIHFIDLFSYLVGDVDLILENANLINKISYSKRDKKFYEVNGVLNFRIKNHLLKISCENKNKKNSSIFVKIKNAKIEYLINEKKGLIKSILNRKINIKLYQPEKVSNVSTNLVNNLINYGQCDLVSYNESSKHHLVFISKIRSHISKILKKKLLKCPIT